jgi:peptide/nickel transport system substrate-binding protein
VLCTVIALGLGACNTDDSGKPRLDGRPAKGTDAPIEKLTWATGSAPRSLDGQHAFDGNSWTVLSSIAEPLVTVDSAGKLVPILATKWDQTDPNTLVFTLREGVTFGNGARLTAEDAAWSISRTTDPKTASEMAGAFTAMKTVKVTGDHELTITLKRPDPDLIYKLRNVLIYQKSSALHAGSKFGTTADSVMATGPYRVKEYSATTGATLVRNETYWGTKPTAKTVEIRPIPDAETLRLALQSGEVDGTFKVPLSNIGAWKGMSNVSIGVGPSPTTMMLLFDTNQPPFNDVHARKAMAYLLDRKGITKALYADEAAPASSMSSPLTWVNTAPQAKVNSFFASLPQLTFDPGKAKKELAQSATPSGFDLTLNIPTGFDEGMNSAMQTLKQNAAALHINITLKEVPVADWLGGLRGKVKKPLGVLPIGPSAPSPLSLISSMIRSDSEYLNYRPDDLLARISAYNAATNPNERLKIAEEVVARVSEDMPVVPIVYPNVAYALNKKYVFTRNYSGWLPFSESWGQFIRAAE